jgi:hypothetical protein
MKLEHYYSDWNGQRSKKPYNQTPTIEQIDQAIRNNCRLPIENGNIFVGETIVEVKVVTGGAYSTNLYRDMYRIIE